jgi:hypothetical protein
LRTALTPNAKPGQLFTPKKREEPKLNSAQVDVLNKIRNGEQQKAAQSPLALNADSDFILVKKRKNVQKVTVSTQTDQSYLQKLKAKNMYL